VWGKAGAPNQSSPSNSADENLSTLQFSRTARWVASSRPQASGTCISSVQVRREPAGAIRALEGEHWRREIQDALAQPGDLVAGAGSDIGVPDRILPAFPDEVADVHVSNVVCDLALELPSAGAGDFLDAAKSVRPCACGVPGADAVDLSGIP
jgi:hypothetical protein